MDEASTRYKVTVSMEEEEVWKSKTSVSTNAEIQHTDAMRIYHLAAPSAGTSVMSPDPTSLVREQLQAHSAAAAPTPSSVAAPATPVSTAGSRAGQPRFCSLVFFSLCLWSGAKAKAKNKGKVPNVSPFSEVALAGKTLAEKIAAVRGALKISNWFSNPQFSFIYLLTC